MSNLIDLLGIQTVSVTETKVIISLQVTDSTKQPYGIVHGGINSVLAETAASMGANGLLDNDHYAVGINISTQHLRPISDGKLVATATPLHVGSRIQTWQVEITSTNTITSTSVVTLTNMERKSLNNAL